MKNVISNKYLKYSLFIITGMLLGWILFHSPRSDKHGTPTEVTESDQAKIWTCAMHPHIRMSEPGKCPICGMDLIPLGQNDVGIDPAAIHLTKEAAELANVLTSVVTRQKPVKEVRLYGKVQADERLLQSQVSHIPGRIEKLMVNFTGETVQKGQTLALLYSPELVTAQQELLEAAKTKQTQPEIYEAVKEKLRLWKVPETQIALIENSGTIQNNVEVVSNTSGIVTARRVNSGDYINQGTVLFEVADLSHLWVLFDAYESDLQFLRKGDNVEFTVQALPGAKYAGKIAFIDPVIDPVTRVAKVRIEAANQSGRLKPEMFVTGIVKARLDEYGNMFVIPKTSVLWTGTRSIVYVKQANTDEPVFKMREVGLGPMLGNSYVITEGLSEGEEIVTQGTFSVDAAAQLEGKPSMMNQAGSTLSQPNEHGGHAIAKEPVKKDTDMDFIMQLSTVYDQYLVLKDAFVQSDVQKVKQAAHKVQEALVKTDMKLLTGDVHQQWMDINGKLENTLKQIASYSNIEGQRKAFSDLSDTFYKAVKAFSLKEKTVYYQFCPMAFDNKGAYWLSENKDIRNPYYGESMLTCGETKETLKY